jgi:hypothetical protein
MYLLACQEEPSSSVLAYSKLMDPKHKLLSNL